MRSTYTAVGTRPEGSLRSTSAVPRSSVKPSTARSLRPRCASVTVKVVSVAPAIGSQPESTPASDCSQRQA